MALFEIVCGVLLIVFSVSIIAVVLSQEGKQSASSVVTGGGGDTFISKNKSRTIDAFLARWTKFIAIMMFVLVIGMNMATHFRLFGVI